MMTATVRICLAVGLLCALVCGSVAARSVANVHTATVDSAAQVAVMLGDSNTWLGGDSCNSPRGWTKWFAEECPSAVCRSYARSGATWTCTTETVRDVDEYTEKLGDNNVIYNQICRLAEAVGNGSQSVPNLIIISAGTNDAWFRSARPYAFDATAAEAFTDTAAMRVPESMLTLAGAVLRGCGMLRDAYPEARIVLLTPMQSTAVDDADIARAGAIIEDCGRLMGLTVIRLDRESCVVRKNEMRRKRMTTDGTHTTVEGARRNGILIARTLNIR